MTTFAVISTRFALQKSLYCKRSDKTSDNLLNSDPLMYFRKALLNFFRACLNFVQQHPYCSKFHHFLSRIEREFVVPAESSVIIEPRESPFHNLSLTYWFKAV